MYGYLFCLKISPCMHLLKPVFLLIFGKIQNFCSNVVKIGNKMRNLAMKMHKNTCLYSYSSLYFYSFLEKTSPYTLIQACTRIRDCRVYNFIMCANNFNFHKIQKSTKTCNLKPHDCSQVTKETCFSP